MFKTIAMVIAVLLVAVLAYAATRPDTFRIERSTRIQAPPEQVFALINDFHRWGAWSPYEKKDPAMKREFSANASGVAKVDAKAKLIGELFLKSLAANNEADPQDEIDRDLLRQEDLLDDEEALRELRELHALGDESEEEE